MMKLSHIYQSAISLLFSIMLLGCTNSLMAQPERLERSLPLAFLNMDALLATEDGTVFAAEGFNGSRVFKITPGGNTTVYAEGLAGPIDMAQDAAGNLYVTNFLNASVSKITPDGTVTFFAETLPFPSGIVIDASGNLYVSQYGLTDPTTGLGTGDAIEKISPDGVVSTLSQGDLLVAPVGITLDEQGNIITANLHNGRVIKIEPNGQQHFIARPTPPEAVYAIGHLEFVEGRIYATGIQTQALYKINPDNGRFRTKDISNRVTFPNGLTYDASNQAVLVAPAFSAVANLTRFRVKNRDGE